VSRLGHNPKQVFHIARGLVKLFRLVMGNDSVNPSVDEEYGSWRDLAHQLDGPDLAKVRSKEYAANQHYGEYKPPGKKEEVEGQASQIGKVVCKTAV
jgi:hypothetical protein